MHSLCLSLCCHLPLPTALPGVLPCPFTSALLVLELGEGRNAELRLLLIIAARSWTGSACSQTHITKTLDSHPYHEERSVDKTLPSFSDTDFSFNFSDTPFFPLGMSLLLLSELLCRETPRWEDVFSELALAWLCSPWTFCLPALHVWFDAAFIQCNSFVPTIPLLIQPPARCQSSLAEECGVLLIQFPK